MSFDGFSQADPGYLKGVPLGNEEFVFDVSFDATRDVAESQVECLSKSQLVEYSVRLLGALDSDVSSST